MCACRCARQGTAAVGPQPPAGTCRISGSGPVIRSETDKPEPAGGRQRPFTGFCLRAKNPAAVEKRREGRCSEVNSVGKGGGGEGYGRVEAFALLTDVCWLLIWATNPIEMTFGWSVGLLFLPWKDILCAQPNILLCYDAQMKILLIRRNVSAARRINRRNLQEKQLHVPSAFPGVHEQTKQDLAK